MQKLSAGPEQDLLQVYSELDERGPIPSILAKQTPDGSWSVDKSFYTPKYTSTHWSLLLLSELALDSTNSHFRSGADYMLSAALEHPLSCHALADRYPQTRELQVVWPQDDREMFRVAPGSVAKSELEVLPVSNSFLFTKPERASGKGTDASLRGLPRILLVLSLTDPSHLFRRPVAFSLLPFCG